MTEHNMNHLNFLETVARDDVRVLREKEATYQGSWKRAGGRSAWFMFRRNMDRLIEMLKPKTPTQDILQIYTDNIHGAEESGGEISISVDDLRALREAFVSEDIFTQIQKSPGGEDGTTLACLRDLRRYATLIEAEMMSRGVIPASSKRPEPLVVCDVVAAVSEVERAVPRYSSDCAPWVVNSSTRAHMMDDVVFDSLYRRQTPDVFYLEPELTQPQLYAAQMLMSNAKTLRPIARLLDRVVKDCYVRTGGNLYITLDPSKLPGEHRSFWPILRVEMNGTERNDLPRWQQDLYEQPRTSGDDKWVIRPEHRDWTNWKELA